MVGTECNPSKRHAITEFVNDPNAGSTPEHAHRHPQISHRPLPTHHSRPSLLPQCSASSTDHSPTRAHRSSLFRNHASSSSFVGPGGGPLFSFSCARSRSMSDTPLPGADLGLGVASTDLAASAMIVLMASSSTREKYAGVSGTYASSPGVGSLSTSSSHSSYEMAERDDDAVELVLAFAFHSADEDGTTRSSAGSGRGRMGPLHRTMSPSEKRVRMACLNSRFTAGPLSASSDWEDRPGAAVDLDGPP